MNCFAVFWELVSLRTAAEGKILTSRSDSCLHATEYSDSDGFVDFAD